MKAECEPLVIAPSPMTLKKAIQLAAKHFKKEEVDVELHYFTFKAMR
jgi:hypothetical protein